MAGTGTPPRVEAEELRSHPPSPEDVWRGNESGRQQNDSRHLDGQSPASPATPAITHVTGHEAASRVTIGSQWEKGEALRSQIEVMKTEFTARLNEIKENNDQKNFKNMNLIEKVQKEAINENTYTRNIIDEISNRLTRRSTSLSSS